jgi:hypothetical protein
LLHLGFSLFSSFTRLFSPAIKENIGVCLSSFSGILVGPISICPEIGPTWHAYLSFSSFIGFFSPAIEENIGVCLSSFSKDTVLGRGNNISIDRLVQYAIIRLQGWYTFSAIAGAALTRVRADVSRMVKAVAVLNIIVDE